MKNSDHKKFEKFHVEISKNWNFADFFLFYLFQLLFFYAPHQKNFFRDSGHIYECSYSSLGAQKRCVWKRYSKNRFFRPKMAIFGPKTSSNRLIWSPICGDFYTFYKSQMDLQYKFQLSRMNFNCVLHPTMPKYEFFFKFVMFKIFG